MILLIGNNCESLDAYSSMTWRVMLKELDETIDDVTVLLNEFIRSSQSLARFEEFRKSQILYKSTIMTMISNHKLSVTLLNCNDSIN